jgi:hypothetical protein
MDNDQNPNPVVPPATEGEETTTPEQQQPAQ